MKGFNLSEWAINHRPFVWFLMILFVAAGVLSYKQLGREEDPSFSIKTMIVRTYWPGATIDDTMLQVTDRIEKKLQETPSLYYLKSETKPGVSTIYVNVLDSTPKEAIPDIWYQVRKKVADVKSALPQGILGPSFNDEFGDVFGIIYAFTADGFTHRELRDYVERIRTQILTIKNAAKAQLIGAQDQKFYLEFDTHQLAGLGVSREEVISGLQEQNAVTPSGVVQTGLEKYAIRVSGAFNSVDDLKRINLYANGKFFRLADVASISKGYEDPPQPMFRFNGEPAIGLAISMAQGGNNLVFGEAVAHKMEQIVAKLPIGVEAHLVADQPVVVEEAVGGFTFIQQQFFPASDRPELVVDLSLPQDASIYATEHEVERFEALLKDDPNIEHYSLYVGQGAVRFYLPLNVQLSNDYFAQAVIATKGIAEREIVRARLQKALDAEFISLNTRIYPLELGPPVGWPLQYRISGQTPGGTRDAAFLVAQTIGQNPNTRLINFDWNEPMKSLHLQVDQDRVRQLGVSSKSLAEALNAVTSGMVVTEVRDSIYLTDLTARATKQQRASVQTLKNLQVALDNGQTIPLSQVATVQYELEPPVIWRRNLLPTITVQADVVAGIEAKTVNKQLAPTMAQLAEKLPEGYTIEAGGTIEESAKGLNSIVAVFPLMIMLMLIILMVQLQSFQKMLLVISVAPLGLIGVVAALLPTGTPMGFVAILGIIALSGMIIRNSVILIDQIDMDMAKGLHPWDAVIDATTNRLRPIVLTAAAASLGMIPIASEVFWGPMAYAIIGGLFVATLLTLLFLPALYVAWFRIKEPAKEQRVGVPEPARAVTV